VDKLDALETKEKIFWEQLNANTEAKKQQRKVINDIAVDKYCKQIQGTTGVTVETVKLVGFGIKGVDDQQARTLLTVKTVFQPLKMLIYEATTLSSTFLQSHNSLTNKITLPSDAQTH